MGGYITEGDPRIFITEEGAEIEFKGGQPVMDKGLENAAILSLFTDTGWPVNNLIGNPAERYGSLYEYLTRTESITLSTLVRISDAAEKALSWMLDEKLASKIQAVTTNPNGRVLQTTITIWPPGNDVAIVLQVTKNGPNWIAQKLDPAYRRS